MVYLFYLVWNNLYNTYKINLIHFINKRIFILCYKRTIMNGPCLDYVNKNNPNGMAVYSHSHSCIKTTEHIIFLKHMRKDTCTVCYSFKFSICVNIQWAGCRSCWSETYRSIGGTFWNYKHKSRVVYVYNITWRNKLISPFKRKVINSNSMLKSQS